MFTCACSSAATCPCPPFLGKTKGTDPNISAPCPAEPALPSHSITTIPSSSPLLSRSLHIPRESTEPAPSWWQAPGPLLLPSTLATAGGTVRATAVAARPRSPREASGPAMDSAQGDCSSPERAGIPDGLGMVQCSWCVTWHVVPISSACPTPWRDPGTHRVTSGGLFRPAGE